MSFKRATESELRAFTVAKIRALLAGKGPDGRKWLRVEIADKADVDPGRITQVLKYGTPGHKVQNGIAVILGLTPDEFHAEAREFAHANPHFVRPADAGHRVESGDPYPNRIDAARIARDSGEISPESIGEVLTHHIATGKDQSVLQWLDDMRTVEQARRLRARASLLGVAQDMATVRAITALLKSDSAPAGENAAADDSPAPGEKSSKEASTETLDPHQVRILKRLRHRAASRLKSLATQHDTSEEGLLELSKEEFQETRPRGAGRPEATARNTSKKNLRGGLSKEGTSHAPSRHR